MYKNSVFLLLLLMVIPLYPMEEGTVECMQITAIESPILNILPNEMLSHILKYVIPHYMANYSTAKDAHNAIVKVLMTCKRFSYALNEPDFKKQFVAALYNKHVSNSYMAPRKLEGRIYCQGTEIAEAREAFNQAENTLYDAIKFIFMVPKSLTEMAYENLKQWIERDLGYEPDRKADSTYGFELAEEIVRLARINDEVSSERYNLITQLNKYAEKLAKEKNRDLSDSEKLAFGYWNQPLIALVHNNNFEAIQLLAQTIDVNTLDEDDDLTPLWEAIDGANYEMVQFLVSLGANVNMRDKNGNASLHMAIDLIGIEQKRGDESHVYTSEELLPIIKFLIDKGADVDMRNDDGETPLHMAAGRVTSDVVCILLENGAAPSICDKDGDTPLHTAVDIGTPDMVRLLLESGADTGLCNRNGDTLLYIAIDRIANNRNTIDQSGYDIMQELLKDKKININELNGDGDTALHKAIVENLYDIIELLLKNGADPYLKNSDDLTAFDLAQEGNDDTIIQILETWKSSDSQPIKKLKIG